MAIYWPDAQLACKTKLRYPKQGDHVHTLPWETSLLNPPSPTQTGEWFFGEQRRLIINDRSGTRFVPLTLFSY